MRFLEIQGGLRVPISNEEQVVLEIIRDYRDPFPKFKLNIREKELAKNLVHKGFVDRILIEGKVYFVYNEV